MKLSDIRTSKFRKKMHRFLAIFWMIMIVPTILWWNDSVLWVALMSLYSNIEVSLSAMEGADNK